MPFTSQIGTNEVVIDDHNYGRFVGDVVDGVDVYRGYEPRDYHLHPEGSVLCAAPMTIPLIDESEWTDRAEEQEKKQTRLSDVIKRHGIEVKDQGRTNYCWVNSPTFAFEVARANSGLDHVVLSPASVGAKIKNFKNVGGWGTQACEHLVMHGAVPVDLWPANEIKKKYDTPEADAARDHYRVSGKESGTPLGWWELRPRSFGELATCVLSGIPVCIGLNWWSHEVTAVDLVVLGTRAYGIRIANSWGPKWSDNGYGILTMSKATPDDAAAIHSVRLAA